MSTQVSTETEQGRNWFLIGGGFALLAAIFIAFIFFSGNNGQEAAQVAVEEETAVEETSASPETVPVPAIQLPTEGAPLQIGDLPYNFALADLAGETVNLDEFVGQPMIINFWATWCAPCRIEMPHLQATHEALKDEGLVVLALDQDETEADVTAFFDEFGLTFTPLLDEGKQTSENYGVGRILPTTFFINEVGEITAVHRGPMTQSQIDGYLAETLP